MGAGLALVNALAYPVLGCLDVSLHLDVRMRTEGDSTWRLRRPCVRRASRRATDALEAVPR